MEPERTARIVDWDHGKRYGFLQAGKERVFLHIRDFAEHHKRPAVGDNITFTMGRDGQGRICARSARHANDGGRMTLTHLMILAGLLVLPVVAVVRLGVDWRWAGGYALAINLLTYAAYASDKRRARENEWRVSEARLQLLALLSGWPAAFVAQRRLRHKCSKGEFQFVFWVIVIAFQFAAFDSLQNWRYSRAALDAIHRYVPHQRPGGQETGS